MLSTSFRWSPNISAITTPLSAALLFYDHAITIGALSASFRRISVRQQRCVMIDLTGVTFIDPEGKALLAGLWRRGAELRAAGCLTRCVVEEIRRNEPGGPSEGIATS